MEKQATGSQCFANEWQSSFEILLVSIVLVLMAEAGIDQLTSARRVLCAAYCTSTVTFRLVASPMNHFWT